MAARRAWADMDAKRGGEKRKKVECLSILFLALTCWLLSVLRYTCAAWQLSGETENKAAAPQGTGARLTPE